MPFAISKEVRFCASHRTLMPDGSREELHGHNYVVRVTLEAAELDAAGMVMDFGELKRAAVEALGPLDHRDLNELPHFAHREPTAELIAKHLYEELSRRLDRPRVRVARVEVWENDTNRAEYRPAALSG